jgi:Uncharacterized protein conserved in bacteria
VRLRRPTKTDADPQAADPQRARRDAVRALARREHSALQLQRKLSMRGVPDDLARAVVEDCAERGWQSDQRYADALIRSRCEMGYGPLRLQAELESAGVDAELARSRLRAAAPDWEHIAVTSLRRRHPQPAHSPVDWQRQYRYLANRGFPPELIRKAIGSDAEPA